jgi:uncharacterized protein (TIGR00730 family)
VENRPTGRRSHEIRKRAELGTNALFSGEMRIPPKNTKPEVSFETPAEVDKTAQAEEVSLIQTEPQTAQTAPPSTAQPQTAVTGESIGSSTTHAAQPGALAKLALKDWKPEVLKEAFQADIDRGMKLLKQLPPAVTFFGGARIKPDDPFYEVSKEIGRKLAASGIPPRTGAGPGIMSSVPEGFVEGLKLPKAPDSATFHPVIAGFSEEASKSDVRTQGFNILLPHEQELSQAIDVSEEIALFPYRKLALYENARGIVTFPGGYGTLDELFEVWSMAERGRHDDPMVVFGKDFWQPLLDAVKTATVDRGLVSQEDFDRMHVTDDVDGLLDHLASDDEVKGFEGDPDEIAARMSKEIAEAIDTLDKLPEAVTFIGGRKLPEDAAECGVVSKIAEELTDAGIAMRVGGDGAVADAVSRGALESSPDPQVQGFVIRPDRTGEMPDGVTVNQEVDEMITHKELLGRRSKALVAMPGGLGTLDELFTVLCQIQCGKLPNMPVVLVGKDYWQPMFDAIRETMLSGERQTISPEDMDLVTIVDTPEEALKALDFA